MAAANSLSRGMDYLSELKRTLGDLTGYSILAFELIQNADDAEASSLVFTFTETALEVWNDAEFSDCHHQALSPNECPLLENVGHRCDFHSFRLVSSEDKRHRGHTIGAFGIGFTAVYQITDRPEVISAGRHWLIDEGNPEAERIEVCGGCRRCNSSHIGTTFVLPWAADERSFLRTRLTAPTMTVEEIGDLRRELLEVIPTTVLFLQNVAELSVKDGEEPTLKVSRQRESDRVIVDMGDHQQTWLVLTTNFHDRAQELRTKYPAIEDSRHDIVEIALPLDHDVEGRLCAYLPTRHTTGLPFHVNADFFPASDRTRLPDEGYRGEWNRSAIHAAARHLVQSLVDLREPLGHGRLWELIHSAWRGRSDSQDGEHSSQWLGLFWAEMIPVLRDRPVLYTSTAEWVYPKDAITINQIEEESTATPFLEWLSLDVAHPAIHSFIYGLPRVEVLGTREINLKGLVDAMRSAGLATPEQPEISTEMLEQAWRELDVLLGRRGADPILLDDIVLAPTHTGKLASFSAVRRADPETRELFGKVADTTPFLEEETLRQHSPRLADLIEFFTSKDAADLLEHSIGVISNDALPELLHWFSDRTGEIDEHLANRLAALPIFPTSDEPKPLDELSIPGGYTDELGLAQLVDTQNIPFAISLLRRLGARELTITDYALDVVPKNADVAESDPERWHRVIDVLAQEVGVLRDDLRTRPILAQLPLVETESSFVSAEVAYFPSQDLDSILEEYPAAAPTTHEAVIGLYEWLGVASDPRPADILARIQELSEHPPTGEAIEAVEAIVKYLALSHDTLDAIAPVLTRTSWMASVSDNSRWFRPNELAAAYQDYLFTTQANFLRMTRSTQNARGVTDLFQALGVQTAARTEQVVQHLLTSAMRGTPVNAAVYRHLNDNTRDPALSHLVGQPCILTPGGDYLPPEGIFRRDHPFGRFRSVLGSDLHGYESLWERLGLRETPNTSDAVDVLVDIANEFGPTNRILDDDAHLVVMAAWRMIELGLDELNSSAKRQLRAAKCISDSRSVLITPDRAIFDDAPEFSDALRDAIGSMLVRKPEGAWRAMREVGVGSLSEVVEIELHEAADESVDEALHGLIEERRLQIARAIDPLLSSAVIATALGALDQLDFVEVTRLEIAYRIRLPGMTRDLRSDVRAANTVLIDGQIFRCGAEISHVDLARELAKQVAPYIERTALVPALTLALQAPTAELADSALDSAGISRLDPAVAGEVSPAVLEKLGGEETLETPETDFEIEGSSDATESLGTELPVEEPATSHPSDQDSAEDEHLPIQTPSDARGDPLERRQRAARTTHLRSYVSPLDVRSEGKKDRERDGRSDVDAAGIEAVLSYERSYGRHPTQMPHHHPGYDVESRNEAGETRYIEVKSLGGEWTGLGAGVSGTQFRKGVELSKDFWLYVVEEAPTDPRVFPIRDPVAKVDQFMFDDNWRLVADPRQRPLGLVDMRQAGESHLAEGFTRVPLIKGDGNAIRGLNSEGLQQHMIEVRAESARFVYQDLDGSKWPVTDPPHDMDRSGRLLLVEFLSDGDPTLAVGWYRTFASRESVVVELTPESKTKEPTILTPAYEADISVLGEIIGRGSEA